MKKLLVLFFILIIYIVNAYPADRTTKKYDYRDFTKVEAGSGMYVNMNQSSSYSIEISAEQEDFEFLKVEKQGSSLRIFIEKNNFKKHGDIRISIQMPELTALDLSGGARGIITMNVKDNFACDLSGGSEISGNLSCKDLNMELSGGSIIQLTGNSSDLTADGSGGSIYRLKDFSAEDVTADLSGGTKLEIKMDGTLNVEASGGSRVVYYGDAKLGNTDFSGGSGISAGNK